MRPSLALALLLLPFGAAAEPSLILHGGRVFLGPGQYAQALAVTGDRISDVGSDADILALKGPRTRVIDLRGRAVTPGFHDADVRLLNGALSLDRVDLSGAGGLAEIQSRVAAFSSLHPDADWILGAGWDEADLPDGQKPARQDLDAAVSTRPVALTSADGTSMWLNSEALRRAGITSNTPIFAKGTIVLDGKHQPTGLLEGDATALANRKIPQPTREQKLAELRKTLALARALGVTSIDAMAGGPGESAQETLDLWGELYKAGEATLRLFVYGGLEDASAAAKLRDQVVPRFPRTRVAVVGVEGIVDGGLRPRLAALLAPYFDEPGRKGEPAYLQWRLAELVGHAHALGLQAALRASGDRAVRMALDACEKSQAKAQEDGDVLPQYPCRVDGADVVAGSDLPRFAALSAAAVLQPGRMLFADQESNFLPNRLGDRAREAFAARSLEKAGAVVAFGSGWPAQPLDPRRALYAAVTRRMMDGRPAKGWMPQERTSLESAIEHATLDAARLDGRDEELGSIKPGKLADLVVFDRDVFSGPPEAILDAAVDATIYDGRLVYQRSE